MRLGPVAGELAVAGGADAQSRAELDLRHDRDPDERRDGRVGARAPNSERSSSA